MQTEPFQGEKIGHTITELGIDGLVVADQSCLITVSVVYCLTMFLHHCHC